jgi:hypothetical protein
MGGGEVKWWESGVRLARDEFSEADHPRGEGGKFGSGGGNVSQYKKPSSDWYADHAKPEELSRILGQKWVIAPNTQANRRRHGENATFVTRKQYTAAQERALKERGSAMDGPRNLLGELARAIAARRRPAKDESSEESALGGLSAATSEGGDPSPEAVASVSAEPNPYEGAMSSSQSFGENTGALSGILRSQGF